MEEPAEPRDLRILLADAGAAFRNRVHRILHGEPGITIVGDSGDCIGAVRLTQQLNPDILLLDWALPPSGGSAVLRDLTGVAMTTCAITLHQGISRPEIQMALRLGARGLLTKASDAHTFLKAIRGVAAGECWFPRRELAEAVQTLRNVLSLVDFGTADPTSDFGLTRREIEIVAAVAAGYTNKDIAQLFSIAENTVKHHLTNIFEKLDVANRLELAVFALKHHLESDTLST